MDYVKLGKSGLKVSRLCLDCMSFGAPAKGVHEGVIGKTNSRHFIKCAQGRDNTIYWSLAVSKTFAGGTGGTIRAICPHKLTNLD